MQSAPGWPRPPCTARPRLHTSILCLTPRCRPHSSRSKRHLHTCTTGNSTAAAFTTFTAALSTDVHSDTWTSSTADPRPGSTANHAATAPHTTDVSATAGDAAAAGNSATLANTAFYTVTAANTTAAASTTNPNTSADTTVAAGAYATAAASSTICPKFTAAAHKTRQPTNITAASLTQHHFFTAAGHVATTYSYTD